jgi:hypothetical protein
LICRVVTKVSEVNLLDRLVSKLVRLELSITHRLILTNRIKKKVNNKKDLKQWQELILIACSRLAATSAT